MFELIFILWITCTLYNTYKMGKITEYIKSIEQEVILIKIKVNTSLLIQDKGKKK